MAGYTLVLLVMSVVALGLAWLGKQEWAKARAVEHTPRSVVKELKRGLASIHGRVHAHDKPLTSPITRMPCVHYELHVEQFLANGPKSPPSWKTIFQEKRSVPFFLQDGTGQCDVTSDDATVMVDPTATGATGPFAGLPHVLENVLRGRIGFAWLPFLSPPMRYSEVAIMEGASLHALGNVHAGPFGRWAMGPGKPAFILSSHEEHLVLAQLERRAKVYCVTSVLLSVVVVAMAIKGFTG